MAQHRRRENGRANEADLVAREGEFFPGFVEEEVQLGDVGR